MKTEDYILNMGKFLPNYTMARDKRTVGPTVKSVCYFSKCKAIPGQPWTGPESPRRLMLPCVKALVTRRW